MKAIKLLLGMSMLMAFSALAQDMQGNTFSPTLEMSDVRASDLMGASVYVTEQEIAATEVDAIPADWDSVAVIDDILFSLDGQMRGVLVDVGGFLGLGARTVILNVDALNFVRQVNDEGVYVVFQASQEELENAPEFQDPMMEQPAQEAPAAEQPVQTDEERLGLREPAEGYTTLELGALTAQDLQNAVVYDRFDERVSDITDVVLSQDGQQVEGVLIDVGGFLGLGARTVSVGLDQLQIQHNAEANDTRVYLNMTREELENLPEYERP